MAKTMGRRRRILMMMMMVKALAILARAAS